VEWFVVLKGEEKRETKKTKSTKLEPRERATDKTSLGAG
jgi:hypothetical protein